GSKFSKASYAADDLYVIGLDGSGMRKISGSLDRDADNLQWAPDGSGVYFTAGDRGASNVLLAPLNGAVRAVTTGTHMLSLTGMSAKGVGVGIRSSAHEPPDVVRIALGQGGQLTPLTHVNDDLLAGIKLADVEEISFKSTRGTTVQGWIMRPPDFDRNRQYPLIFEIHGGPHAMYGAGFEFMFQTFAANGYTVLYMN